MTPPEGLHTHRPAADRLATIVMAALGALAALVSLFVSPFFGMTTNACDPNDCDGSTIAWAYGVTWGGVVVAAVVAVGGMVYAARRKTLMWIWPALALVLVVATFILGSQLASSAAPGV